MHVLECHATMAHASTKSHRIDVNVNEAMKVRHAIEHRIHAQVSFATTEVSVILNKISNQCVNVPLVIEERIATKKMVCADDSVRCLLVRMSCMLFFLAFFFLFEWLLQTPATILTVIMDVVCLTSLMESPIVNVCLVIRVFSVWMNQEWLILVSRFVDACVLSKQRRKPTTTEWLFC